MHSQPSRRHQGFWLLGVIFIFLLFLLPQVIIPTRAQGSATCDYTVAAADVTGLINAITNANASIGPETICLATDSTYTLTAVDNTTDEGANGLPVITDPLTIQGNGAVITRESTAPAFRFFQIDPATGYPASGLTLSHLTLSGGSSDTQNGGAIYVRNAPLTITNSTFENNAANYGGAIYAVGEFRRATPIEISTTTFESNQAQWNGAAVYLFGAEATILASNFFNNTTVDSYGKTLVGFTNNFTGTDYELTFAQNCFVGNTPIVAGWRGLDNWFGAWDGPTTSHSNSGGGDRISSNDQKVYRIPPPDCGSLAPSAIDRTIDVIGVPVYIYLHARGGIPPYQLAIETPPAHGTLEQWFPEVRYIPETGYSGSDSFTYSVTDSLGRSDTGIVDLTLGDYLQTTFLYWYTSKNIPADLTMGAWGGTPPYVFELDPLPDDFPGTVAGTPPYITYTPALDYVGAVSFSYHVTDDVGATTQWHFGILVQDDLIGDSITIDVPPGGWQSLGIPFGLNLDLKGAPPYVFSVGTPPSQGTVIGHHQTWVYRANLDAVGQDSFVVTVTDTSGATSQAIVTINITPTTPLQATDQTLTYAWDALSLPISLAATGGIQEGFITYNYVLTSRPTKGTLVTVPAGLAYQKAPGATGQDSFTFMVTDRSGFRTTDEGVITINLEDAPTTTPLPVTDTPIPPTATPLPPTSTPAPPTNTPLPSNTPVPAMTFYRAINLGGTALTVDGNAWEGSIRPHYTTNGFAACNPWQPLDPATDPERTQMIQCQVQHWAHNLVMNDVPTDIYAVYLYAWLDWADPNPQPFSVQIEGQTVQSGITMSGLGSWRKLGPWIVAVSDGSLNLTTSGGLAGLSGFEVWRVNELPTSTPYPTATFPPTRTIYPTAPMTSTPLPTTPPVPTRTSIPSETPFPADTPTPVVTEIVAPPTNTPIPPTSTPGHGIPLFYRAINLGGDALTIDDNAWESQTAPSYTTNGNAACNPWTPLTPETDVARTTMIQCHVQHWAHLLTLSSVPNGTYDVSIYAWLDWDDPNAAPFSVQVEGQTVQTGILITSAGQWLKLGPWRVTVSDGSVDLATDGALVNLSGIEVWTVIEGGLNGGGGSD